jgi:DNA invertase Pin-like site-specific DNA recombinase
MVRCAVYTRKSSEEGLEQSFNSLDAQREACEAYILSQRHEGWQVLPARYDDGGFSGGNIQRPALKRLLDDVAAKRVDTVVVYKVDRLTRSLADFAKIVEQFDGQGVSFVSVTQQFNTTSSMGRLTLNVLLSFAQFEREMTGERIRDKIAASKRKGMWMGGVVPLGYDLDDRRLVLNPEEAKKVNHIFRAYLEQGCVSKLQIYLEEQRIKSKKRVSKTGNITGDGVFCRGALYLILQNRVYLGEIKHKDQSYPGQQPAIIDQELWDKVQEQLKSNLQSELRRANASDKSLLLGLLYDGEGNRFTPSYAKKKGRRYRYYVSRALLKLRSNEQAGPTRLPAGEIEELVIAQVRNLLRSPQRLLEVFGGHTEKLNKNPQCLMCGEDRAPATLHDQVQIRGASTSGVPLVSFNADAFEKYGWTGNDNAPVCNECMTAYVESLRRLTRPRYINPRTGKRVSPLSTILTDDTTAVYWAAKDDPLVAGISALRDDPKRVGDLLQSPRHGQKTGVFDANRFYCLILTGAQGRAIVRRVHAGTVADVDNNLRRYFGAIGVDRFDRSAPLPQFRLLKAMVLNGELDRLLMVLGLYLSA